MNCLRRAIALLGTADWRLIALAVGLFFASGCETLSPGDGSGSANTARNGLSTNVPPSAIIGVGEQLKIDFLDISPPATFDQTVRDDGSITLAYQQNFDAAGKSENQLQEEIQTRYVPRIYKRLTVNIQRNNRYYFVRGEVKNESMRPYPGDMTVLKAIASAGGFTVFADKKKVELIRSSGEKVIINAIKAQKDPKKYDLPVYPGDQINVPLSWK